jgi:predicted nucleotidyltransferase
VQTREALLQVLRSAASQIESKYGIRLIGLTGSWARGDAQGASDADIAFETIPGRPVTLLDIGGAHMDLRARLDLEIDLIDWRHLREGYREGLERDLIRLDA